MIIIGEKINATRKGIGAAIEARDAALIARTATEQVAAGAHYIDVNGGDPRPGQEAKNMAWLMEVVQGSVDLPASIDSADAEAVRIGLEMARRKPIVNSISLERHRLEPMLPLLAEHECVVVALLMTDGGTPCGVDDRRKSAAELIERLLAAGKKLEEIIVDPCFLPVSADAGSGRSVVEAIAAIRKDWAEVHIGGGLSNMSFGLPQRRFVNLAALAQCIFAGMDVAIVDPCVAGTMETIYAAEAVAGRDHFCMNYVRAMR